MNSNGLDETRRGAFDVMDDEDVREAVDRLPCIIYCKLGFQVSVDKNGDALVLLMREQDETCRLKSLAIKDVVPHLGPIFVEETRV